MKTILIFGLPGSGKTTMAKKLMEYLGDRAMCFNGDDLRKEHNDWDFSEDGRRRQANRMRSSAEMAISMGKFAILDFVCPKEEYREIINPDYTIWMNRKPVRDFPDTTAMFEKPQGSYWQITDAHEGTGVEELIANHILDSAFNDNAPTALMIGRFQPFHAGHKALFLKALEKHGQVCIAVRDMPRDEKNPYDAIQVVSNIENELSEYRGKYTITILPNIVDVVYGRDVGWTVSKIDLPPEIEAISATKIREEIKTGVQLQWKNIVHSEE